MEKLKFQLWFSLDVKSKIKMLMNSKRNYSSLVLGNMGCEGSRNAAITILKSNRRLKELELINSSLFTRDVSTEFSFHLKVFRLFDLSDDTQILKNLDMFLKTQSGTIEKLFIQSWTAMKVFKTISSFHRLKKLYLGLLFSPLDYNIEDLPQNHSVTELFLNVTIVDNSLETLLKAFPKLEVLIFPFFTDETADLISETAQSLRRLCVDNFKARIIANETFYCNLVEFHCIMVEASSRKLFEKLKGKIISGFEF